MGRFGFKLMPPGAYQVPGFTNEDTHSDVIRKAANGLGIQSEHQLLLIVSKGLIMDGPLSSGEHWTLGGYTSEIGGVQIRSKRAFGIVVSDSDDEPDSDGEEERPKSEVSHHACTCRDVYILYFLLGCEHKFITSAPRRLDNSSVQPFLRGQYKEAESERSPRHMSLHLVSAT